MEVQIGEFLTLCLYPGQLGFCETTVTGKRRLKIFFMIMLIPSIANHQGGTRSIILSPFLFHAINVSLNVFMIHGENMNDRKLLSRSEVLRGWFELIRPPNLFTVPGDILAGASLAFIPEYRILKLFSVIGISILLYISGLILNDYCDRETDRTERPSRPLPSGRVRPGTSLFVSVLLISTAFSIGFVIDGKKPLPLRLLFFPQEGVSVFQVVLILVVLILLYNGPARRIPWLGFVLMGSCRGLNILFGAAVCDTNFSREVLYGAGIEALYIVLVSSIAYSEVKNLPAKIYFWLPYIPLFMLAVMVCFIKISPLGIGSLIVTIGWISSILRHDKCNTRQLSVVIGNLIRGVILIQITIVTIQVSLGNQGKQYFYLVIVFLLIFFFASRLAGKKFYGS
ncbi:MAG: hypothetical protein E3K32_11175 [wastewater metagenome]|nr:hypothetical protein [Candidatus Loosdrechtia aerotolerans]